MLRLATSTLKRGPRISISSLLCTRHLGNHPTNNRAVPPLAFAFDIDGVLLQGPNVLPEAKRALALLEDGGNSFGLKIPYILLTNGGGVGEAERCEKLTQQLGSKIAPAQYIQSHTILKALSHKHANDHVLVLGGKLDAVRQVAEGYGFRNAHTTTDFLAWKQSVWPFHEITEAELRTAKPIDFSATRICAVFVFHDPRDWALDVQILCDVIQSNGFIGGPYVNPQERTIDLVFCNPDLLWRSDFPRPRLGQGAFKEAFQSVYKARRLFSSIVGHTSISSFPQALTGSTYPYTQYGKPTKETYKFAEGALMNQMTELYGPKTPLPHVYMIGDNPESDIAGANAANWTSILVHTGVFDPHEGAPSHIPTHEASDVEAAVRWAIGREAMRAS